jgi:hypothetical protein
MANEKSLIVPQEEWPALPPPPSRDAMQHRSEC